MTTSRQRSSNVRWRTVALPTEHGGWGFIGEPVVLGLLLAPSASGFTLGIAAFAAFLFRQPLKIYFKDVHSGHKVPRTLAAHKFTLLYGGIMAMAGLLTLVLIPSANALLPLLFALPFVAVQLAADLSSRSRTVMAELAGAIAPGAIASAVVLMRDWSLIAALSLWLALAIKAVTAVLYVRARLRLERSKPVNRGWVMIVHMFGLVLLVVAAAYRLLPWTTPLAMSILLIRAAVGLASRRKPRPPKIIGMQEIGYGLGFVLLTAFGYILSPGLIYS